MICNICEGTRKLGFQQEDCNCCYGTGYIEEKIVLNKREIEEGLNELIKKQLTLIDKLNNGFGAFKEDECEERLKLISERDQNDYILNYLFNLQSFQYMKSDFGGVFIE